MGCLRNFGERFVKRIAIATLGTQGDVQPYLALALALMDRGYSVVLGAPSDFQDFIESHDVEFQALGSSIQQFLTTSRFDKAMSENSLMTVPALLRQGQLIVETAARLSWDMAQGADALILNLNTSYGIDIAEALGIPAIMTALQPLNSTGEFPYCMYYSPNFMAYSPNFGKALNRLTYTATAVQQIYYNLPRNRLRRQLLGLAPLRRFGLFANPDGTQLTTLYAFSSAISPRPRDWPKSAIITGYWQLADRTDWEPSDAFKKFLSEGEPPVYIGFGSMPFGAERNTQILREAVKAWGGRAVVARGWGGINPEDLPDSIFAIEKAPHDKLFKYVRAVVHHGGAGTTAAGLSLGRPTFVVPQTVDQPYWGRRVYELGCGPAPVRLRKLTSAVLAETLSDLVSNEAYAANALTVSEKLQRENGVEMAANYVEMELARVRRRSRAKVRFG